MRMRTRTLLFLTATVSMMSYRDSGYVRIVSVLGASLDDLESTGSAESLFASGDAASNNHMNNNHMSNHMGGGGSGAASGDIIRYLLSGENFSFDSEGEVRELAENGKEENGKEEKETEGLDVASTMESLDMNPNVPFNSENPNHVAYHFNSLAGVKVVEIPEEQRTLEVDLMDENFNTNSIGNRENGKGKSSNFLSLEDKILQGQNPPRTKKGKGGKEFCPWRTVCSY